MACCLPTCAHGSLVLVMCECSFLWRFGFDFLASSRCPVHMESASFASLPVVYRAWVTSGVPPGGHALWAEVGEEHYLCNLWGECFNSS